MRAKSIISQLFIACAALGEHTNLAPELPTDICGIVNSGSTRLGRIHESLKADTCHPLIGFLRDFSVQEGFTCLFVG